MILKKSVNFSEEIRLVSVFLCMVYVLQRRNSSSIFRASAAVLISFANDEKYSFFNLFRIFLIALLSVFSAPGSLQARRALVRDKNSLEI